MPIVIDEKGEPISDAFVVAIRFRLEMTATSAGHLPVLTGAGIAKILVDNTLIRGVPPAEWEDKQARWTAQ